MTQFIAEHQFIFATLCVFALITVSDAVSAWASAWAMRKYYEKEAEK